MKGQNFYDVGSLKAKADAERAAREAEALARWRLLSITDLAQPLPPIPWLCEGIGLAPGAVSLVAGYGYSRKTMALQSAAVSVAAGKRLWGVYSTRAGRVLHLDYEQGQRITQERYQRLARGMGFELGELPLGQLTVASMPLVYLDGKDATEELMRLCDGVTLVIIDSLRAAFPRVDENSSEVRSCLDGLNRVSERTGATLCVVHHARKPNKENADGATFAIRGSSALFDACQSVYVFEGEKDVPTTVHHQKDRIRGATVPPFGLTSEDVTDATASNARWGLRVTHMEAEQMRAVGHAKEKAVDEAEAVHVRAAVVEMLTAHAGTYRGSKHAFREACGPRARVRHARFVSIVEEMVADGTLAREGSYHEPVFTLASAAEARSGIRSSPFPSVP